MDEAILQVVKFMAISARTAPKTKGQDYLEIKILGKDETKRLGQKMIEFGKRIGDEFFIRDGENVKNSSSILLLGLKDAKPIGANCGLCGFSCKEIENKKKRGPFCVFRMMDLGIALGSAAKTASIFNVDNRIMYRAGIVAAKEGFCNWDIAVGIPLSVTGKNIFFDRKG